LNKDYAVCFYSPYDYIENFVFDTFYIPMCKNQKAIDVGVNRF